jgi:hypothetical protein
MLGRWVENGLVAHLRCSTRLPFIWWLNILYGRLSSGEYLLQGTRTQPCKQLHFSESTLVLPGPT